MEITIYTDGASRGNPGKAAIGLIIYDAQDNIILQHGEVIGTATNNVAEYKAVVKALQFAHELNATSVKLFADSQLLIKQLEGSYKVKNEGLRPLYEQVKQLTHLLRGFRAFHIPRDQNKMADKLANLALDGKI